MQSVYQSVDDQIDLTESANTRHAILPYSTLRFIITVFPKVQRHQKTIKVR